MDRVATFMMDVYHMFISMCTYLGIYVLVYCFVCCLRQTKYFNKCL